MEETSSYTTILYMYGYIMHTVAQWLNGGE